MLLYQTSSPYESYSDVMDGSVSGTNSSLTLAGYSHIPSFCKTEPLIDPTSQKKSQILLAIAVTHSSHQMDQVKNLENGILDSVLGQSNIFSSYSSITALSRTRVSSPSLTLSSLILTLNVCLSPCRVAISYALSVAVRDARHLCLRCRSLN